MLTSTCFLGFGCAGASLLHTGLLQLLQVGAPVWLHTGFSYCRAQALGGMDSVVATLGL